MFLNVAVLSSMQPPPQGVLDKRSLWQLLIGLLAATTALRLASMDIVGGVLSSMLLCLACVMVTDGMQELPRYALTFGMLCLLCFFFDAVPLFASIGGRSEIVVKPMQRLEAAEAVHVTYVTVVRTTPFFDHLQGIVYNLGSASMVLAPVATLLGSYLAIHAHLELHRYSLPFSRLAAGAGVGIDDASIGASSDAFGPWFDDLAGPEVGSDLESERGGIRDRRFAQAIASAAGAGARAGEERSGSRRIGRFQGTSHRLDQEP